MSESATHHRCQAHHFENIHQQAEAASLGTWSFLVTELMLFSGLFMAYILYRMKNPEAFIEASHPMNVPIGAFNTTVLLVSSFTICLAVHAAQTSNTRSLVRYLWVTAGLGGLFLIVKAFEYAHKFEEHLFPGAGFSFPGTYAGQAEIFFVL